jgi:hypothetical protein
MLMKMNEARMWWPQSISGLQDGSQKPNQPRHSQRTVINTHTHKHLLDTERYHFVALNIKKEVVMNNGQTP